MSYAKKYDYKFVPIKKKVIFKTKTGKKVRIYRTVWVRKRV